MGKIYDNDTCLLGSKKDIIKDTKKTLKEFKKCGDDYVCDTCFLILDAIKKYNDDDMLCVNYEGLFFKVICWTKDDMREVK
jgi:hypothetical protein